MEDLTHSHDEKNLQGFKVKQYGEATAASVVRHAPIFCGISLQNWELAEWQK